MAAALRFSAFMDWLLACLSGADRVGDQIGIGGNMNDLNRVLIVDNEPFIVEELTEFLESQGVECVSCIDSTEAINLFHADESIGLVLSDYRMPDINGIELIRILDRTKPRDRLFESILFTGDADKEDVIDALRAGISDYYQKPLDLQALLTGVQRLQTAVRQRAAAQKLGAIGERIKEMSHSLQELQPILQILK